MWGSHARNVGTHCTVHSPPRRDLPIYRPHHTRPRHKDGNLDWDKYFEARGINTDPTDMPESQDLTNCLDVLWTLSYLYDFYLNFDVSLWITIFSNNLVKGETLLNIKLICFITFTLHEVKWEDENLLNIWAIKQNVWVRNVWKNANNCSECTHKYSKMIKIGYFQFSSEKFKLSDWLV